MSQAVVALGGLVACRPLVSFFGCEECPDWPVASIARGCFVARRSSARSPPAPPGSVAPPLVWPARRAYDSALPHNDELGSDGAISG